MKLFEFHHQTTFRKMVTLKVSPNVSSPVTIGQNSMKLIRFQSVIAISIPVHTISYGVNKHEVIHNRD